MRMRDRFKLWWGEALLWTLWLCRMMCKPVGLCVLYRSLLIHLLKKTDLFDRCHYLETNGDVAREKTSPLSHYASYGDREGRWPMPLFDPAYYRTRAQGRTKHINALLHYAYVGRYRRISPSPWFDVRYYLAQNKDVARSGIEPMRHYLKWGGLEGRSPNPQFDGAYYLRNNPEVRAAHLNPLLHYLQYGHHAGLPTRPANELADQQKRSLSQQDWELSLAWQSLLPMQGRGEPKIDVIVPVYKDRELTLRCLFSILTAKYVTPFELVVINDASPDGMLVENLEHLASRELFTLLHNQTNRGFVYTVNRGMLLHPDRDVVLLNSDTEVYGNWLDRMRDAAHRHPRTATVTPLSNNATICSYPRFLHDNPYPLETDYETLDSLTARVNAGYEVEAPTGVGFCMYMRRDALADIGTFDEETFGKGYGEENDFCQRAIARGWRNVISADIFVRHVGGASFQGEKAKRTAVALKTMARRHPGYRQAVEVFIHQDPLAEARKRLDWERLKRRARTENVLIVCHNRGGGAERHVQEDIQRLRDQGKGVFYLRPERGRRSLVRIGHPACRLLLNLSPFKIYNIKTLASALKELRITCIHSHGLIDFTADAADQLLKVSTMLGVPLHVDIHDYKVICPRINLVDENGFYCGEPSIGGCEICIAERGSSFGVPDIREWRYLHHRVLKFAEKVWVPSRDVATRLLRYYPDVEFTIAPHDDVRAVATNYPDNFAPHDKLRIVIIGAIGKMKGFDILHRCAKDAQKRNLPLEFIILGHSINDRLLNRAGVFITGMYQDDEAFDILRSLNPHVIFLPSIWPETYSYTLSIALGTGLPIFAFEIGAIAERLKMSERDEFLMSLALAFRPQQINNLFIRFLTERTANTCHMESA